MNLRVHVLVLAAVAALSGGCVVYEPVPVGVSMQERFDRSWAAATGAMYDQGLAIDTQDRARGIVRGSRGGVVITGTLETMADGSIQVRFQDSGARSNDPKLIHRVSESYERRMGR